ncbi:DgyrCDS3263 [Dimorphilus gyrociliatus]|uniref:DgyrCDS3263 n=1 Tax=Dimorphilus gyrociliatus TaxID=2664684 RepID=A0A7I8VHS2_9ANNE|nr:DgyrCDS3263 [Dimorphilus gyrociliatus]
MSYQLLSSKVKFTLLAIYLLFLPHLQSITLNRSPGGTIQLTENNKYALPSGALTFSDVFTVTASVGAVTVTLLPASVNTKFEVVSSSNTYTVQQRSSVTFDYDSGETSYTITYEVSDTAPSTSTFTVTAQINDWNDETPVLGNPTYVSTVTENQAPGIVLTLDNAIGLTDGDAEDTGHLVYSLAGTNADKFAINPTTGEIKTAATLDYESLSAVACKCYDTITILGIDRNSHTATSTLTVSITDANDNTPRFSQAAYYVQVTEGLTTATSLATLACTDNDLSSSFNTITYTIKSGDDASAKFSLGSSNGLLQTTTTAIDYETNPLYTLLVECADSGSLKSTGTVIVDIVPVNENTPVWQTTPSNTPVSENEAVGFLIMTLTANDADTGNLGHGDVVYELTTAVDGSGASSISYFNVDPVTGKMQLKKALDYETSTTHTLTVKARDNPTTGRLSVETTITISVTDYNEFSPVVTPILQSVTATEDASSGAIATLTASDSDGTKTIGCSLQSTFSKFSASFAASTCTISLASAIDPDQDGSPDSETYTLIVLVTDGSSSALITTATVSVSVAGVNDKNPTFASATYTHTMPEDTTVGTTIKSISATDQDFDAVLAYTKQSGDTDNYFLIESKSNQANVILQKPVDYDSISPKTITLALHVTDGSNTATADLTVTVSDVLDSKPSCNPASYSVSIDEKTTGSVVTLSCTDDNSLTYAWGSPSGNTGNAFALSASTGAITVSTSSAIDYDAGTELFQLTVRVTGGSDYIDIPVTVAVNPVNNNNPLLTASSVNVAESASIGDLVTSTFVAADADRAPHNVVLYELLSGAGTPAKFVINPQNGEIRVADTLDYDTSPTSYSLSIKATDGAGNSDTKILTVTLDDANDNIPTCDKSIYNAVVNENVGTGSVVQALTCTDADTSGNFGTISYTLTGDSGKFSLDTSSSPIQVKTTASATDYETVSSYTLVINMVDNSNVSPKQTSSVTVYVAILPLNDNAPTWGTFTPAYTSPAFYQLAENTAIGTSVATLAANDVDLPTSSDDATIRFGIISIQKKKGAATTAAAGTFTLDSMTGLLKTSALTDRDDAANGVDEYLLNVKAENTDSTPQSVTMTITVSITDVNEHAPFFSDNYLVKTIEEGSASGTSVAQLAATDADGNSITYAFPASGHGNSAAKFSLTSGGLLSTTASVINLDAGTLDPSSYDLVIIAKDGQATELTGTVTVHIDVTSKNDFAPTFSATSTQPLAENTAIDSAVITLTASDDDSGADGTLTYVITSGNTNSEFVINPSTGEIRTAKTLNRESTASYNLVIEARDDGTNPNSKTGTVTQSISLLDSSDENIICTDYSHSISLAESHAVNSAVGVTISCSDADSSETPTYTIISGNTNTDFAINPSSGIITLAKALDYDSANQFYSLTVRVTSGSSTLDIPVTIQVTGVNEHTPVFSYTTAQATFLVSENSAIGHSITSFTATDADYAPHSVTTYSIEAVDISGGIDKFQINQHSAALILAQTLDYESDKIYKLTIKATDGAGLFASSTATVSVTDVNDNTPSCTLNKFYATANENSAADTNVIDLSTTCTDGDHTSSGANVALNFAITGGDDSGSNKFKIGSASGLIQTTANQLDFETTKIYALVIRLVDGTPGAAGTNTATTTVQVTVLPVNEHTPTFSPTPGDINKGEDSAPGTELLTLGGSDSDDSSTSHGQFTFALVSAKDMSNTDVATKFRVDASNGKVYTADFIDRETTDYYSLVVKVTDGGSLSTTASFTVNVDDVNEFEPAFSKSVYTANLAETAIAADAVITTVTVADSDKTNSYTFSISGGDTTKFKQTSSGDVATIKVNTVFDPDALKVESYSLEIKATDQASSAKTATTTVIITIVGNNDNTPNFATDPYTHNLPESQTAGATLFTVAATDGDFGRDAALTYSERTGSGDSSDYFGVGASGEVYLKKMVDYDTMGATKVISFIVDAVDNGVSKNTGSTTVSVTVTPVSDVIPSCTPPALSATVNENAASGFTAATLNCNDDDALSYSIQAATNIDTAFDISSTGVITIADKSGSTALDWDNAAKPKIYNLVVDVTDGTNTINIPVAIALQPINEDTTPSFPSNPTVNVLEDRAVGFSVTTYAASDDDADPHHVVKYEISAVDPSTGASLFQINQATGEIAVASSLDYEAATKVFKLTVVATDGGGAQGSGTVTVSIDDVNDNAPSCTTELYAATIDENSAANTDVTVITGCTDADTVGNTGAFAYTINSGDDSTAKFAIDTSSGVRLRTTSTALDYETKSHYELILFLTDNSGATPRLTSSIKVIVDVQPVNDNSPTWGSLSSPYDVSEAANIGQLVLTLAASDSDRSGEIDSEIVFTIESTTATLVGGSTSSLAHFSCDPKTGIIRTSSQLQRDGTGVGVEYYTLSVKASDRGTKPAASATTTSIRINVQDVNDEVPSLDSNVYNVAIPENSAPSTSVLDVVVTDNDATTAIYSYSLTGSSGAALSKFSITSSGRIQTLAAFNLDGGGTPTTKYTLLCTVGDGVQTSQSVAYITITPTNDAGPSFTTPSPADISIPETTSVGDLIGAVAASDADYGDVLTFTKVAGSDTGEYFHIDSTNGNIYLRKALDYDTLTPNKYFSLNYKVTDSGSLSATVSLTVSVTDVSDKAPTCTSYTHTLVLAENTAANTQVVLIDCTEPEGESMTYAIQSGGGSAFEISAAGSLKVKDQGSGATLLDYDSATKFYSLVVRVTGGSDYVDIPVTILLTGINDNTPTASNPAAENVAETSIAGYSILTYAASDADHGADGSLSYQIISVTNSGADYFTISSSTGEIFLAKSLDYETQTTYAVTVRASDAGSPVKTVDYVATFNVVDSNDNKPTCTQSVYVANVDENSPDNTPVQEILCSDADSGAFGTIHSYTISNDDPTAKFKIVSKATGADLKTSATALDYETKSRYELTITINDNGGNAPVQVATVKIIVLVNPVNEHTPVWGSFTSTHSILENVGSGHSIFTATATDQDSSASGDGQIIYSLVSALDSSSNSAISLFRIDPVSGDVETTGIFEADDATPITSFTLVIRASDQGATPKNPTDKTITINLQDYNDNDPKFSSTVYHVPVAETSTPGATLHTFTGTSDGDKSTPTFTYTIVSGDTTKFGLKTGDTKVLLLQTAIEPDLTTNDAASYQLVVRVTDGTSPIRSGTATVYIAITSVNDFTPSFNDGTTISLPIPESQGVGVVFKTLSVTDNDFDDAGVIVWEKSTASDPNNFFTIDSSTGALQLAKPVDYETVAERSFSLQITAKDKGSPVKSQVATVTITVTNVNDNVPTCNANSWQITKEISETTAAGTTVADLDCSDPDGVAVSYAIQSPSNTGTAFQIDSNTGVITVVNKGTVPAPSTGLDYDSATKTYNLIVDVTATGDTISVGVSIALTAENDNNPTFASNPSYSFTESIAIGQIIATYIATDDDHGPQGDLEYSILSVTNNGISKFTIDQSSGKITLAGLLDYDTLPTGNKKHEISVRATDGGSSPAIGTVTVVVTDANDNSPICTSYAYNLQQAEATASGSLPFTVISDLGCSDADDGTNAALAFTITGDSNFAVVPGTHGRGELRLTTALNFEATTSHTMSIQIADTPGKSVVIAVTVQVTAVNEGPPVWTSAPYTSPVSESAVVGSAVYQTSSSDPDGNTHPHGKRVYSIQSGNTGGAFSIDPDSGLISVATTLNRETVASYSLGIRITEQAGTNSADTTIAITVTDVNDSTPSCTVVSFNEQVLESVTASPASPHDVIDLSCSDADPSTTLTYTLTIGDATKFKVSTTGVVQTVAQLDFEVPVADRSFSLRITISDGTLSRTVDGIITVGPVNEATPIFTSSGNYPMDLLESTGVGTVVVSVTANDADSGDTSHGQVEYAFHSGSYAPFAISSSNGDISLIQAVDRDTAPTSYTFKVKATDGGSLSGTAQVVITLTDANDNAPVFNPSSYSATVLEESTSGTQVVRVTATDADDPGTNNYGTVGFSISSGNTGTAFAIDATTGWITVTNAGVDYDSAVKSYALEITATDSAGAAGAKSSSCTVIISVTADNDNPPSFTSTPYTKNILENQAAGSSIFQLTGQDNDHGADGSFYFSMANHVKFALDSESGIISLKAAVDYETPSERTYTLTVKVIDRGATPREASTTVTINVGNVNDNTPSCTPRLYAVNIREDATTTPATQIVTPACSDADSGTTLLYSITFVDGVAGTGKFAINGGTGAITLATALDYETSKQHSIIVKVSDQGAAPTLTTTVLVVVNVLDVNEAAPVFGGMPTTHDLYENTPVGNDILTITATDADTADTITYAINPADTTFEMDPKTGLIKLKDVVDRETRDSYTLTIVATDSGTRDAVKTTSHSLAITILDRNEKPVFSPAAYVTSTSENTAVGSTVLTVTATDTDLLTFGEITYSIVSGNTNNKWEIIKDTSNGLGRIKIAQSLDYESEKSFTLTVRAQDGGPLSSEVAVVIGIEGYNEITPNIANNVLSIQKSEATPINTVIHTITAVDTDDGPDGMNGMSYSITSGDTEYMGIDPLTGEIRLLKELDREAAATHSVVIRATDSGTNPGPKFGTATLTLTVTDDNDQPPVCTPAVIAVEISESISPGDTVTNLQCQDADASLNNNNQLSYALTSGDIAKFSVSSTGQVTVKTGNSFDYEDTKKVYNFEITVTDGGGTSLSSVVMVTVNILGVNEAAPAFTSAPYSQNVIESTAIGQVIPAAISATDSDDGIDGEFAYSIASGANGKFDIDPKTGEVRVINELDRETTAQYILTLHAIDKAPSPNARTGSATLTIDITDENDNYPVCSKNVFYQTIAENADNGDQVIDLGAQCSDNDDGINKDLEFTVNSGNTDGLFGATTAGVITIADKTKLDYETKTTYTLTLTLADKGTTPKTLALIVHVAISNINEETPTFLPSPYSGSVVENDASGTSVKDVVATDDDSDLFGSLTYSITAGNTNNVFAIHPTNGRVSLAGTLDREVTAQYVLTIKAVDGATGADQKTGTATLSVSVTDFNDKSPSCPSAPYTKSLPENSALTPVITVSCTDSDADSPNNLVTYAITNGNANSIFTIDASTGAITTTSVALDYETTKFHQLTITASDNPTNAADKRSATAVVYVEVEPVNENDPLITAPTSSDVKNVNENMAVGGAEILTVQASDADEGVHKQLRYFITGGNSENKFSIDETNGKLFLAQPLNREATANYALIIIVKDSLDSLGDVKTATTTASIVVDDYNDNYPVFTPASYTVSVVETTALNTEILTVTTTDDDLAPNNGHTFTFLSGNDDSTFDFVHATKKLRLLKQLDHETKSVYVLKVEVADGGTPELKAQCWITVNVLSVNEFYPVLSEETNALTLQEDTPVGTVIYDTNATDSDTGAYGIMRYGIVSGNPSDSTFVMDPVTGKLSVSQILDYDTSPNSYTLNVSVYDNQGIIVSGTRYDFLTLTINLVDVNDNYPVFTQNQYSVAINENLNGGVSVFKVQANDADSGVFGTVAYAIQGGDGASQFTINANNGDISTIASPTLDFEAKSVHNLLIRAEDGANPKKSSYCSVRITLNDVNDNDPIFSPTDFSVEVVENLNVGTSVTKLSCSDSDSSDNARLTFSIVASTNVENHFRLTTVATNEVLIDTLYPLDRETKSQYVLNVIAVDAGTTPRTGTATVTVNVGDVNDNDPYFLNLPYTKNLYENTTVGSTVFDVDANDKDSYNNGKLQYEIVSGNTNFDFTLDPNTGLFRLAKVLNREEIASYAVVVRASDFGSTRRSATTTLNIVVSDNNDVVPSFSQGYQFSVLENSAGGTVIGRIQATDADLGSNGVVQYSIQLTSKGPAGHFTLDSVTGYLSTSPQAVLDREINDMYTLLVRATDQGSLYSETNVQITITDANDNKPAFVTSNYVGYIKENEITSKSILQVSAVDKDTGNNGEIAYSIQDSSLTNKFSIDSTTGSLTNKIALDREEQSKYTINILAVDRGSPALTTATPVTVYITDENDNAPSFNGKTFLSVEAAYNEKADKKLFAFQATDPDDGLNGQVTYGITDESGLFKVDPTQGIVTFQSGKTAAVGKKYLISVTASDGATPSKAVKALVRVDTYSKTAVCVSFVLQMASDSFNQKVDSFLASLKKSLAPKYPNASIHQCGEAVSGSVTARRRLLQSSSTTAYVYALSDSNSDLQSNVDNPKSFIDKDVLLTAWRGNTNTGDPSSSITGSEFSDYNIKQVQPYPTTSSSETPWIETQTGLIVVICSSVAAFIILIIIIIIVSYCLYKNHKKPPRVITPIPRKKSVQGPANILPRDNLTTVDVAPTLLIREPNKQKKNIPPKSTSFRNNNTRTPDVTESMASTAEITPTFNNGKGFDGTAFDPDTGKMYEYNTKTNERRWVSSSEASRSTHA